MLGNFNGNFDQWLIRAADKTPYEKKQSSITRVQELNTDHRHQSAPRGANGSLKCNTGHKLVLPRTKNIIIMAHSALLKDLN